MAETQYVLRYTSYQLWHPFSQAESLFLSLSASLPLCHTLSRDWLSTVLLWAASLSHARQEMVQTFRDLSGDLRSIEIARNDQIHRVYFPDQYDDHARICTTFVRLLTHSLV